MNVRLCVLLIAALTLVTKAQNTLPPHQPENTFAASSGYCG
jgi:hypothetical protein